MSTPLWDAASRGYLDTVMLLVERGADIELMAKRSPINMTALWATACNGQMSVVMYLLNVGAKVEAVESNSTWSILKDSLGYRTILLTAASGGQTEAVENSCGVRTGS